jgi:hypothetical protein
MRLRAADMKSKENEHIVLARAKQMEQEKKEFELLKEGGWGGSFEDFRGLVDRMRAPFSCDFDAADGKRVDVRVSPDDAAVLTLDSAALEAMNEVLATGHGKKRDGDDDNDNAAPKKRRRNNAAAETGLGLGRNQALCQADRRDRNQNAKLKQEKLKQHLAEKTAILKTLALVDKRKRDHEATLKPWQRNREAHEAALKAGAQPRSFVGCMRDHPFWWLCREGDTKACQMILQMFLPKHGFGCLGKANEAQWKAVQDKTLVDVDLTESSVSAREEKLRRRLTTVEQAIQASQQTEPDDEDPAAMNVWLTFMQILRTMWSVLKSFEPRRSLSFDINNIKLLEQLDRKHKAFVVSSAKAVKKQLDHKTNHWCFHSTELELWDSFSETFAHKPTSGGMSRAVEFV